MTAAWKLTTGRFAAWRLRWWLLAGSALALSGLMVGCASSRSTSRHGSLPLVVKGSAGWITTWGAAPQPPVARNLSARGFDRATIRQLAFTSIGGTMVRIRVSNVFGSTPLLLGAAAIGVAGAGGAVAGAGNRVLSFGGRPSVRIAPGAEALSDPVTFDARPLERLAVSLYFPAPTGPATGHVVATQTNYVASGNRVAGLGSAGFTTRTTSWYFLDAIDVLAPPSAIGSVVALGDSITDGVGSSVSANQRWPNDLARRLDALPGARLAVVDEGISGNLVLSGSKCCGESAVARFQRDIAARPGAREVILLEGVNDIGSGAHLGDRTAAVSGVTAAQIIAGDERIIAQAHADRLKIFGATLTPFKGAAYWTPAGEAKRAAVDRWIRTGGAFDGVIDFATVLADPADPEKLDPAFDRGDHLHPNSAGYQRMADSIDIAALVRDA